MNLFLGPTPLWRLGGGEEPFSSRRERGPRAEILHMRAEAAQPRYGSVDDAADGHLPRNGPKPRLRGSRRMHVGIALWIPPPRNVLTKTGPMLVRTPRAPASAGGGKASMIHTIDLSREVSAT